MLNREAVDSTCFAHQSGQSLYQALVRKSANWEGLARPERLLVRDFILEEIRTTRGDFRTLQYYSDNTGIPLGTLKTWYHSEIDSSLKSLRLSYYNSTRHLILSDEQLQEIKLILGEELSAIKEGKQCKLTSIKELAVRFSVSKTKMHEVVKDLLAESDYELRRQCLARKTKIEPKRLAEVAAKIEAQLDSFLRGEINELDSHVEIARRYQISKQNVSKAILLLSDEKQHKRDIAIRLLRVVRDERRPHIGPFVAKLVQAEFEISIPELLNRLSSDKHTQLVASFEKQRESLQSFGINAPFLIGDLLVKHEAISASKVTKSFRSSHILTASFLISEIVRIFGESAESDSKQRLVKLGRKLNVFHYDSGDLAWIEGSERSDLIVLPIARSVNDLNEFLQYSIWRAAKPGMIVVSAGADIDLNRTLASFVRIHEPAFSKFLLPLPKLRYFDNHQIRSDGSVSERLRHALLIFM